MSDDSPKKPSDRQEIERRRQMLLREVTSAGYRRSMEKMARSGVCLTMRFPSGEEVLRRGDWEPSPLSRSLARDPDAPADLLLRLAWHLADDVLDNPTLPLLLLENPGHLLDAAPGELAALARSPRATSALLDAVLAAGQPHVEVRLAVAAHRATPPHLLQQLASDPDDGVRAAAEQNPSLPPSDP